MLLTFIKLPFVINIFGMSILSDHFTQDLLYRLVSDVCIWLGQQWLKWRGSSLFEGYIF